jgi:5'-nucleotidase
MMTAVNADCAILNSGALRSDTLHDVGEFKAKDLKRILPYINKTVVISLTGAQLHEALENAVSQFPEEEGRFAQVSGIRFVFDPSKPSGNRVDPQLIKIQEKYLDLGKVVPGLFSYPN